MQELISDFIKVQNIIKKSPELANILESIFEEDCSAVVMIQDVTKYFPYENFLINTWERINDKLQATQSPNQAIDNDNINDVYFYGCLYATLMMEDVSHPGESPVLISLTTLLRVGLLRNNEEFMKPQCQKVFRAGFKGIHSREIMEWDINSELFFDSLKAIKIMNMSSDIINSYINFMMIYAGKHYNMVNNLSLADNHSPVGVLAFACLANLFVKNCPDKQNIMETMLENIEHVMESNADLSSFQISVKQSNFRLMIRQVGNVLTSCMDHLFFAIIRVAERHPKSKSLVFIINQLPYGIFCRLVNVIVKLCNRTYCLHLQMFSFNMLESPYITEQQEEIKSLERVYQQIAESIIWPLQKYDHQPVVETIKLIYAMLQIQNTLVKNLILKMTVSNPLMCVMMTYINQYCNENWRQEYKVMNQYFVSVYCRLLILNKDVWRQQQFTQFTSLLLRGNPHDLNPCMKDLKALIASPSFQQSKEVQSVILNSFILIGNQTSPQAIHFLRSLHDIIFGTLRSGKFYYDLVTLKTNQGDTIIKKMVTNRLITQRDIENLSVHCRNCRGWRLMADIILYMDFLLPKEILHFAEDLMKMKLQILKDTSAIYIFRFFGDITERKAKLAQKYEKEILMRFSTFLEGCLLDRQVPIHSLPVALLAMRKFHTHFNRPLARLQLTFHDIETITRDAFKQIVTSRGNFNSLVVLTRDICYFAELQLVFGDLDGFKTSPETNEALETAAHYFPNIKDYTHLGLEMIQCITKWSIRNEDSLNLNVNLLYQLIKYEQPRLKECCVDCLYDIALFRTSNFDVMIPHVYDLLTTNNPLNAVTALNMYSKLFAREHSIPNDWQTFTIALAVSDKNVANLIKREVFEAFMDKLHPYFETYFIHIMFYSNEICDHADHLLLPELRQKIIREKLSAERRHHLYTMLMKYFTVECRTKILNYIYKELESEYTQISNPNNIIEDVLVVTYQALKQQSDYPELSRYHYERTLAQIKKLENYTTRKMGNGINVDEIIQVIINTLVKMLNKMNEQHVSYVLKFVHVMFAIIDWNYVGIFNATIEGGLNSKLRINILKLLEIYNVHNHAFHFNDNDFAFQERPIQSVCDRI